MKKSKLFIFLIVNIVLLISCGAVTEDIEADSCLPPIAKIAYPIGTPTPVSSSDMRDLEVVPFGSWHHVSDLPEPQGSNIIPQIIIRSNQIWVLPFGSKELFRYDIDTHKWKIYDTIDGSITVPQTLFLTKNGDLWGVDVSGYTSDDNISFLSWYNEITNQFEFVKDVDNLLNEVITKSIPAKIVEDQRGVLWFIGSSSENSEDNLYSFNPSTRKAMINLDLSQYVGSALAVDKNGALWLYGGGAVKQLLTFSTTTHQVRPYLGPPDLNENGDVLSLFFDKNEWLWINNEYWLDFSDSKNPVWHKIIPPPEFLTDDGWFWYSSGEKVSTYGIEWPFQMSQSSNGWYWFTTFHGTILLDFESEEWCLFTTGISPVVEDSNGNVWIVVFDKLYNYRLEP